MEKPYKPISCSLYDHIELFALRGKAVTILYKDEAGKQLEIRTIIKDTRTSEGVEYLVLENDDLIRLDLLLNVAGLDMNGTCKID